MKLTAWLPDALEVRVRDLKSGKIVATLTAADEAGLFETVFTRRKNPFPYQLIASYADASADIIDLPVPGRRLGRMAELTWQPENLYHTLGAQLRTVEHLGQQVEVRFAVYAPSATAVSLIGDFNFWDGRRHPMQRSQCGHWVLFVPGAQGRGSLQVRAQRPHGQPTAPTRATGGFLLRAVPLVRLRGL